MPFGDLKHGSLADFLAASRAPDALCLFMHIPKTAGSSLANEIAAARKPYRNIHIDYRLAGVPHETQMQAAVERFIADARTTRFRSASGHFTGEHAAQIAEQVADTRLVTFLRNPVERVISDYRYQTTPAHPPHLEFIARHPTIDSYIEAAGAGNKISRHILGRAPDAASEVLEALYGRFAFAGVVEMYPMCFNLLFELFGHSRWPSIRVRTTEDNPHNQVEVTPALTARIEALNAVDMAVYADVRATLEARQAEWRASAAAPDGGRAGVGGVKQAPAPPPSPRRSPRTPTGAGRAPRVAILAHGHPDYSAGGAEMAAYSLFRALGAGDRDAAHLITWVSPDRVGLHAPGEITRLHPQTNEWLYHSPGAEWLYQQSHSRSILTGSLIPFLKKIDPDIIHFHHFLGFGLDAIRLIRSELPDTKIVFTLHEFLAICLRDGQMVTSAEGRLCSHASPVKCSGCFTGLSRSHFALREEWFRRHFALVDGFLSPSRFLRDRYVDWGIPADRIEVIDNAQICTTIPEPASRTADQGLFATFGFFGQINPYKGAEILVEAARSLLDLIDRSEIQVPTPRILVYGTMSVQSADFQARMLENLASVGDILDYRGGYDRHEVLNLMSACGWVVTPSIWWENAPVVIEEAFQAGRPVICSNIGGMREKVADGVNGLHFRARDPHDLARVMMGCLQDPDLWERLRGGLRRPPGMNESARSHHDYYQRLTAGPGQAVPVA